MDATEWALLTGIVGAAAWIPPVITGIRSYLDRPKLTIVPSRQVTVGFTELGPVLNVKVAITSNQNILVDSVQVHVEHESGATFSFKWHEVIEVKGQVIIPGAESQPVYHQTEAIAMKILPSDFKDVELRNRLADHTEEYRRHSREYAESRRRLTNLGQYEPEKFFASGAVQDMVAYLRSQMIWKHGKYSMQFRIGTKGAASVEVPELKFNLLQEDIELLQENCNNLPRFLRNACYHQTAQENEKVALSWSWLTQPLIQASAG